MATTFPTVFTVIPFSVFSTDKTPLGRINYLKKIKKYLGTLRLKPFAWSPQTWQFRLGFCCSEKFPWFWTEIVPKHVPWLSCPITSVDLSNNNGCVINWSKWSYWKKNVPLCHGSKILGVFETSRIIRAEWVDPTHQVQKLSFSPFEIALRPLDDCQKDYLRTSGFIPCTSD